MQKVYFYYLNHYQTKMNLKAIFACALLPIMLKADPTPRTDLRFDGKMLITQASSTKIYIHNPRDPDMLFMGIFMKLAILYNEPSLILCWFWRFFSDMGGYLGSIDFVLFDSSANRHVLLAARLQLASPSPWKRSVHAKRAAGAGYWRAVLWRYIDEDAWHAW